ncbi:MAG: hypothetical protein JSS70_01550 [Bacteroidetes bacterium]|nr:hypothetical protein [Bacteroidota bacterium]
MKRKKILFLLFATSFFYGESQTAPYYNKLPEPGLFESDKPLDIVLTGNTRALLNDRVGEAKYFPFLLSYQGDDSSKISIPVDIKTRGHFRRLQQNCIYPPLLVHLKDTIISSNTLFPVNVKLKLVMPCKADGYVVKEWLVYKLYNLVTHKSFRTRLVKVTMENEKNKKPIVPFFGILLEDEQEMALRNQSVSIIRKIKPNEAELNSFLTMAVFEYLIGNTDWSVEFLQNIKLIAKDSSSIPVTVAYDFDHAGIVNAPYALPAPELQLTSCRERRYRGYCIQDMKVFDSTIALYNRLKEDIYNLYAHCTLLDNKYIKSTTDYLDEFYKTINNPKLFFKEFSYPCDKNGTGNVIIKGLKED